MAVRPIIAGVCDTLKRYSIGGIMRYPETLLYLHELKRRAGSRALRRPVVTLVILLLIISFSPFSPCTRQGEEYM